MKASAPSPGALGHLQHAWSVDSALGGMAIASILTCLVGEAEGFSAATVDGATVDVEFGPSFVGADLLHG